MRFAGLEITVRKRPVRKSFGESGRWHSIFGGYDPGWFQKDIRPISADAALAFPAAFACQTLIAGDIGKLRPKLMALGSDGIWEETSSPAFSPVLKKPNRYQNHIQFKEWWIASKLSAGNAYALKGRDSRGIVTDLYLLDPRRCCPLVAPDGEVFYSLGADNLAGLQVSVYVPASEIIHDRMNCLFHPLVGLSPIFACGMSAHQGLEIQRDAVRFFGNSANPGGVLTAPGKISDDLARRMSAKWDEEYSGQNSGKVAVLGEGLTFAPMRMTSVDAQLIEQLKMTAEVVCSTHHVPGYMVGVGAAPLNNNVEALAQQYYSQCLQTLIESMELCLNEGLGLDTAKGGVQMSVELDLTGLLRMDTKTQIETLVAAVDGTLMMPNEGRKALNLKPTAGGDALYKQQQNFSLAALAKRDALPNPFVIDRPSTNPTPSDAGPAPTADPAAEGKAFAEFMRKTVIDFDEALHA